LRRRPGRGLRRRLFCVGDPKQSIYRFRDVDRRLIENTEAGLLAEGGVKFDFTLNRRSTPSLLKLVNAFSARAFPESLPSEAARDDAPDSAAQILTLGGSEETLDAQEYAAAEARQVADQIEQRAGQVALDRLAVLYRASGSVFPLLKELQARGIPYSMRGGQNLFERQEIQDMHRLLYFLADPSDDISLIGSLRSPLFLLSDATLYMLCLNKGKELSLWEHFSSPPTLEFLRQQAAGEAEKAEWAMRRMVEFLALSRSASASRLIETALRRESWPGLYALAYREPQRALALEQWLDWLKTLELDYASPRLDRTVRLLKEVSALLPNKPPLGDVIGSKNCVALLTIHAAKGLQFDSVFLIGMNRKAQRDYPLLQRLGASLAMKIPEDGGAPEKTARYQEMQNLHRDEEREETKRLLYVAMTRAENRLTIYLQGKKPQAGSLQEILMQTGQASLDPWKKPAPLDRPVSENPGVSDRAIQSFVPVHPLPAVGRTETTVSELETFLACPLKQHLAYERQAPANPADLSSAASATEIGTYLHQALNLLHADPKKGPQDAVSVLMQAEPPGSEAGVELTRMLQSYLASPAGKIFKEAEEDFSEMPFLLKLAGGELRGQIDRLLRLKDGWMLVDFKYSTRSHSAKALLELYGFQLKTYALAAEQILRLPLHSVQIHLLNQASSHEFLFSEAELAGHRRQLEELMAQLRNTSFDLSAIRWRPACAQCAYHVELPLCTVPQGVPWGSLPPGMAANPVARTP